MEHDYAGSVVEAALAPEPEGDFAYIQGMSGVATYMRVEGLDVIGADAKGNTAMVFNSEGMYRGRISSNGKNEVAIYKNNML